MNETEETKIVLPFQWHMFIAKYIPEKKRVIPTEPPTKSLT